MNLAKLLDPRVSLAVAAIGVALVAIPLTIVIAQDGEDREGKEARASATPNYASAVVDEDEVDSIPTPPIEMRLVDESGFLRSPQWDDRHLTPEEKAADPAINPRWEPFARCMEAAGVDVRVSDGSPFLQADIDRLVEYLNSSGPLAKIEDGKIAIHHTEETQAYTSCFMDTMAVFSEDLYKILTPEELERARANGDAPKDGPPAEGTVLP